MTCVAVMQAEDLWEGEVKGICLEGAPVLLVRLEGEVRAYPDRCPHLGVRLSEGELRNGLLTCAAHQWCFELRSGRGINPATTALRPLTARVAEGVIWVSLPGEGVEE